MAVHNPVAGSFSRYAQDYLGPLAGFLAGWNYWVLYVLVGMAELTAVGKYVQFWWPEIPSWVSAVVFFVLVNLINTLNVKVFGEMEFWFALVKVLAIIGFIILGVLAIFAISINTHFKRQIFIALLIYFISPTTMPCLARAS